jgi:predicted methyltransferase
MGSGLGACKKQEATPTAPAAQVDAAAAAPAPAPEAAKTPDAATAAADSYQTIVDAADRTADDRNSDASRKPAELLRFIGVKPGWKVADLGAGGGYLTELLQRAVQPGGVVYGQNVPLVLQKFGAKPWTERLARPIMKGVVRADRELGDPLPPEAKDLDLVTIGFFYHDATWLKTDRDAMNKKIFDALKPGGLYVVTDHSAKDGAGATVGESLHRIEKKTVIDEVTKAGFKLDGESDIYANPKDTRDTNVFDDKIRGNTDRFVLRFVKPVAK